MSTSGTTSPTTASASSTEAEAHSAQPAAVSHTPTPHSQVGAIAQATHYCVNILPTSFRQGRVAEKPRGFAADSGSFVAPIPDSGRLEVRIRVTPDPPVLNKPFQIIASFVNDGDLDRRVTRIEESAHTKGGMRPLKSVKLPAEVKTRGSLPFYRYEGVFRGEFEKTLRVFDRHGDSWQSTVHLEPCD